ncbi:unnamed protein product, partial [marine sediment metagenome]
MVLVHGGGWGGGDKVFTLGWAWDLAKDGYTSIAVNYRRSGEAPFPAAISDVKCAVRWLYAHAEELNVDTSRMTAMGHSAGGHLVALLGTANKSARLEGDGPHQDQPSNVKAVVAIAAVATFDDWLQDPQKNIHGAIERFLGVAALADRPDLVQQASPLTYVSKDDPPFLLIHGTDDKLIPVDQARRMGAALEEVGVPAQVHIYE